MAPDMTASLPSLTVRLFGKLPSHGDFVARGLAAMDRDALDRWLSAGLKDARAAFGPDFDALYDHAPAWRFAAMEGEGDKAVAGVLAPSIDRAGRRYPLYLVLAGIDAGHVVPAAEWCEELIRDAFRGGWDVDRLVREAAGFVSAPGETPPVLPGWWSIGGEGFMPGRLRGRWPERLLSTMLQPQEER